MTPEAMFTTKYFGVADGMGGLATQPTSNPYIDSATAQLEGEKTATQLNVQYFATPECAADLASVLSDLNPTIVQGPPDDWNATFEHGVQTPATAPWLQFTLPTTDKTKTNTTQVNAGVTATFFSHGCVSTWDVEADSFPGSARVLAAVRQQIQLAIDGAPNF